MNPFKIVTAALAGLVLAALLSLGLEGIAAAQYYGGGLKQHGHSSAADGGWITNLAILGSIQATTGTIVMPFATSTTTAKRTGFEVKIATNSAYALAVSTPGATAGNYVFSVSTAGDFNNKGFSVSNIGAITATYRNFNSSATLSMGAYSTRNNQSVPDTCIPGSTVTITLQGNSKVLVSFAGVASTNSTGYSVFSNLAINGVFTGESIGGTPYAANVGTNISFTRIYGPGTAGTTYSYCVGLSVDAAVGSITQSRLPQLMVMEIP